MYTSWVAGDETSGLDSNLPKVPSSHPIMWPIPHNIYVLVQHRLLCFSPHVLQGAHDHTLAIKWKVCNRNLLPTEKAIIALRMRNLERLKNAHLIHFSWANSLKIGIWIAFSCFNCSCVKKSKIGVIWNVVQNIINSHYHNCYCRKPRMNEK